MEGELRIHVLRPDQPEALLARRVAQVHAALLEELLPELAPTPEEQAALLDACFLRFLKLKKRDRCLRSGPVL